MIGPIQALSIEPEHDSLALLFRMKPALFFGKFIIIVVLCRMVGMGAVI
jgi:hypothetical protein